MTIMSMEVSEELAEQLRPIGPWLPTIIELGLVGFTTVATAVAAEVVQFLSQNPSPQEVLAYHVSNQAQKRLRRLLTLNEAGLLSEEEQRELDELEQLEHILIMLKAQVASELPKG
ncbi:MAG TPA: hypothetical protein EYP41_14670 [Anaerolineae bacterium]|nr:hypothetical protein [Anaerolineae bacterium]HIP72157.1 hypothetical protein [Anaerolineae bacterium]